MHKSLVDALRAAVAAGDDATQELAQRVAGRIEGRSAAVLIAPPFGPSRAIAFNTVAEEEMGATGATQAVAVVVWLLLDPTGDCDPDDLNVTTSNTRQPARQCRANIPPFLSRRAPVIDIDSKQTTFVHVNSGGTEPWLMKALYKLEHAETTVDLAEAPAPYSPGLPTVGEA